MHGTLDLRRLRYFLAVTDNRSVSAAARALNLAQPALSYHMTELERLTGHALLNRSRGGVVLTEAGRLLERHARDIVRHVDAAETALARLGAGRAQVPVRLRIAIISTLAAKLTPLLYARLGSNLPDVTLHIIEAGTRDIEHRLQRKEADMAIFLAGSGGSAGAPLASEQLFLLAPPAYAAGNSISLAELAACRLVLPAPGNPLRDFVDAMARSHGVRLDVVLEVDGARPRHNAVLSGIGATIIGAQALGEESVDAALTVREIVAPRLFRPIFLGARRDLDPGLRETVTPLVRDALLELGLTPP